MTPSTTFYRALAALGLLLAGLLGQGVAHAEDTSVAIVDHPLPVLEWAYAPATTTVTPGSWVTWSNEGSEVHTVTATDASFDSGELKASEGFSVFFETPGSYSYYCDLHPWMVGQIDVVIPE